MNRLSPNIMMEKVVIKGGFMYAILCHNCLNWHSKKRTCLEGWRTSCCGADFQPIINADSLIEKSKHENLRIIITIEKGQIKYDYIKEEK